MNIRPVKTEGDYDAALERIEALWGAAPGTSEGDELDVLLTLVSVYEQEHHPVPPPSPVEAIRFVMEQKGLRQADLVPFFGSRAKVSEVLNGKRTLTLSMVRALHGGLGIPAEVLIQEGDRFPKDGGEVDWEGYPVSEIVSHGWVQGFDPNSQREEIMRDLARQAGLEYFHEHAVCLRQGGRENAKTDPRALQAWILKVRAEAGKLETKAPFKQSGMDMTLLRKVGQLSVFSDGPRMAGEYLLGRGVKLVFVPHLRRTHVDGVVFIEENGSPVIGMSLRYDRIDYFWFTLLHELAHVALRHLRKGGECIVDDLDLANTLDDDELEREADKMARQALIPDELWMSSPARTTARIKDVQTLARAADIHQAIVAGRVRREKGNYRLLSRHVGQGEVRKFLQ